MNRILVCDDDEAIVNSIEIYLQQEGYELLRARDGMEALEVLSQQHVDLIILDIMMPRMDGIEAIRRIRTISSVPVIMLSAKSEDEDKILGLNLGADDYVTKPFSRLELTARVRSHLRRYQQLGSCVPEEDSHYVRNGGIEINDQEKSVTIDGTPVRLTPTEYGILLYLMQHAGQVFSSRQLYEQIWGEELLGADNTVAVHIRHLREKIEINPKEPRYLKAVWGVGYKMEKMK